MKIKLLVKKIKHKIIKFLYEYFKKIYIRNINISDNEILQYAHNELTIAGHNKNSKYYNDIIEVIAAISKNNNINSSWEQVSCLKGIRLEDVTPELDSKAYAELKNNKH